MGTVQLGNTGVEVSAVAWEQITVAAGRTPRGCSSCQTSTTRPAGHS